MGAGAKVSVLVLASLLRLSTVLLVLLVGILLLFVFSLNWDYLIDLLGVLIVDGSAGVIDRAVTTVLESNGVVVLFLFLLVLLLALL